VPGVISAVIPVFNGERFIASTLRSVLAQTHLPLEVIVVDDGSTDSTERIVRHDFPAVTYHRQPNRGAAAARNLGVELSRGEWIAFLDADDLWYPEKLAVQSTELTGHPNAALIYSDLDFIDADGNVSTANALSTGPAVPARRRRTDPSFLAFGGLPFPYPSAVMVRKEVLLRAGGFNSAFRGNYHEDLEAFARVFRMAPARFIPRSLVGYRVLGSRPPGAPNRDANWLLLLNSLWQLWSSEPERQSLLVDEFARHYAHAGKRYLRARDYERAREALRLSLAYRRGMPKAWGRLLLSYLPGLRELYSKRKAGRVG
jgi:glycosyltransferase involved in cell wall biosynthesis